MIGLGPALVTDGNLTRVLQGLVAGAGLLEAGTIVNGSGQDEVRGLTTAAGARLTATIAGMGREPTAVCGAFSAMAILCAVAEIARLENRGSHLRRGDIR